MPESLDQIVLRLPLQGMTVSQFCDRLVQWSSECRPPRLVSYLNAHNVNLALDNSQYANILASADLLYADGMGVVWGWRHLGTHIPERVSAGDFIFDFCKELAATNRSLFLVGSYPGVAEKSAAQWKQAAPNLKIVGTHDGYFTAEQEDQLIHAINKAAPSILMVGMGVPRQEIWAAKWREKLNVPVIWCVGALFEYSGMNRSRAPMWMRRTGLEWVWRLALEPRRMARRYLLGNIHFILNIRRLSKLASHQ